MFRLRKQDFWRVEWAWETLKNGRSGKAVVKKVSWDVRKNAGRIDADLLKAERAQNPVAVWRRETGRGPNLEIFWGVPKRSVKARKMFW